MNLLGLLAAAYPDEEKSQQLGLLGLLPSLGGSSPGPPKATPGGGWEAKAQQMAMNKYGYSPQDWNKLDYIIERESGWDPTAYNESSGAAGIPQNINGWLPGWQENPMKQLRWLFNYIDNHNYPGYGTGLDAAYQHKLATGWY